MNILTGSLPAIDRTETLRYLGYYSRVQTAEIAAELDGCEREALEVLNLKAVYSLFDVSRGDFGLDLGFAKVRSLDLGKYLEGCGRIALFAATAGAGIDRLIVRYNRLSPARAAMMQALGAAAAEQWCNKVHARLTAEYGAKTSRFSCGYGDLPLTLQRDIFAALSVTRSIGVTLSENCFMTPSKSVTAIVGIPGGAD